jgi:hypothetical protein
MSLEDDIRAAINRHNAEANSDTPDFILAGFLVNTLKAYEQAVAEHRKWCGPFRSEAVAPTPEPDGVECYADVGAPPTQRTRIASRRRTAGERHAAAVAGEPLHDGTDGHEATDQLLSVCLMDEQGRLRHVRRSEVQADVGRKPSPPLTDAEMQNVMFGAKLAYASVMAARSAQADLDARGAVATQPLPHTDIHIAVSPEAVDRVLAGELQPEPKGPLGEWAERHARTLADSVDEDAEARIATVIVRPEATPRKLGRAAGEPLATHAHCPTHGTFPIEEPCVCITGEPPAAEPPDEPEGNVPHWKFREEWRSPFWCWKRGGQEIANAAMKPAEPAQPCPECARLRARVQELEELDAVNESGIDNLADAVTAARKAQRVAEEERREMGERLATACVALADARRDRDEALAIGSEGQAIHQIQEQRQTIAVMVEALRCVARSLRVAEACRFCGATNPAEYGHTPECIATVVDAALDDAASISVSDAGHHLRIIYPEYGGGRPYVEVSESHAGEAGPAQTWPLPEVVHLLQNIDESTFHHIGCADLPVERPDPEATLATARAAREEAERRTTEAREYARMLLWSYVQAEGREVFMLGRKLPAWLDAALADTTEPPAATEETER